MLPAAEATRRPGLGRRLVPLRRQRLEPGQPGDGARRRPARRDRDRVAHDPQVAVRRLRAGRPRPRVRAAGARSAHRAARRDAAAAGRRRAGRASRCERRVPDRASYVGVLSDVAAIAGRCRAAGRAAAGRRRLGRAPRLPPRPAAARAGARRRRAGAVDAQDAARVHPVGAAAGARRDARPAAPRGGVRPAQHHQPVGRHLRVDRPRPRPARARRRRAARPHAAPGRARPGGAGGRSRASGWCAPDAPAVHAHRPDEDRRLARRHRRRRLHGRGRRLRGRHPVRDGRPLAARAAAARRRLRRAGSTGCSAFLPASIERRRGTPRPPLASVAFTAASRAGHVAARGVLRRPRAAAGRAGRRPHLRRDRDAVPARHPGAGARRGRSPPRSSRRCATSTRPARGSRTAAIRASRRWSSCAADPATQSVRFLGERTQRTIDEPHRKAGRWRDSRDLGRVR